MMDGIIIDCLVKRILAGQMTIEQAPEALREAVLEKLTQSED